MTIPLSIPTAEDALEAPDGLPDVTALARLANEFFSALPGGGAPAGISAATPQVAAAPPGPAAFPAATHAAPAVPADHPTPSLAPVDTGHPAAPAADPAALPVRSAAPGVPPAYAPALPQVDLAAPRTMATSGFYFAAGTVTGGSNAIPGQGATIELPTDERVTAKAFGLPGEAELKQLLHRIETDQRPPTAPVAGSLPEPRFYFVDTMAPAAAAAPTASAPFDVEAVRRDFPILAERVNGRPLIWLDNAATTHKPRAVIERLAHFYTHENSNIHRAAHELAARATDAYEGARAKVQRFLGAATPEEIVFVRGATEGINLVAQSWGRHNIRAGDEIVVSHLEHHANIVPWQQLAAEKGARLRVIPVDDTGQLRLDEFRRLLNERTRLVAVAQVSNALGTIVPVREVVQLAHSAGAKVLVDGAQSVSHMRVDVRALDADFFVFSGHKVFAPTGIGVVYGKREILEAMPPWQGGGNMIADVTFERTLYHGAPARFEAGTGNIADAVGLGAALDYVERIGMDNIARYEHALLVHATAGLSSVPGLRLVGTARDKASVLSFVLEGYKPEEVGRALNREGIAVRSGHHCAQPILRRFGHEATVRPSLAFYNTCAEVDTLVAVLWRLASARRRAG